MNVDYFMDPETGHVLPVELSPDRIDDSIAEVVEETRQEFLAEAREELEASGDEFDDEDVEAQWTDTREEDARAGVVASLAGIRGFLGDARCVRKDEGSRGIEVYDVGGFHFAVYDTEDGFGERFPNCVLVAATEAERRSAAEALGLPCIEGAVDDIFGRHTGLIDRDDARSVRTMAI